jgi:hypothetical protein
MSAGTPTEPAPKDHLLYVPDGGWERYTREEALEDFQDHRHGLTYEAKGDDDWPFESELLAVYRLVPVRTVELVGEKAYNFDMVVTESDEPAPVAPEPASAPVDPAELPEGWLASAPDHATIAHRKFGTNGDHAHMYPANRFEIYMDNGDFTSKTYATLPEAFDAAKATLELLGLTKPGYPPVTPAKGGTWGPKLAWPKPAPCPVPVGELVKTKSVGGAKGLYAAGDEACDEDWPYRPKWFRRSAALAPADYFTDPHGNRLELYHGG